MRQSYCETCQGEGIIYPGSTNGPDTSTRGWCECWDCHGKGYRDIPHHHILVRELIGPYGPYVEASCGDLKETADWCGDAIEDLVLRLNHDHRH